MPAVNLNRLYRPQARERRPILDNVHIGVGVPDAAGAHQRATMPALRAQLGIIGDEANSRIADVDRKSRAIQGAFSAAGRALDIVDRRWAAAEAEQERARERQEASTLMDIQNRYRQYRLDHADEIYNTPYDRTQGEDGKLRPSGPLSKAIEVHEGFWEADEKATELRETLGERARMRLDAWFTDEGFDLKEDAAKEQAERQQQYMQLQWKRENEGYVAELKQQLGRGSAEGWARTLGKMEDFAQRGAEVELGYRDLGGNWIPGKEMSSEDASTIASVRREVREKYTKERVEFLYKSYIEDGNPDTLAELEAWGMTAKEFAEAGWGANGIFGPQDETQELFDADRLDARRMKDDAIQKRQSKLVQDDALVVAANSEELAAFGSGKRERTEEEHAAALADLLAVANGLQTESARTAYLEKVENAQVSANTELCARVFASLDDPGDRDALLLRLEGRIGELQSPTRIEALKKQIQDLKAGGDLTDFNKTWEEKFGTTDSPVQFESAEESLAAIAAVEKRARELKTPEARAAAFDRIQKRNTAIVTAEAEAKKEAISNILAWAEYGYIPVVLDDGRTGRKDATFDELLSAYRRLAPDMTVAQAAKVRSSLKDLAAKRAELPTEAEILQTFEWLGVKPSARREIFGDWGEDGRFERSARSLFAYGSDGWEIDKTAYERMDAPKPADRDGYISVRRSGSLGGGQIELTQDALGAVLGALQAYKRSQRLSDNPPALEKVLGERLTSIRDHANAQSIIEAAKEATRIFEEQFDAPIYYQTLED